MFVKLSLRNYFRGLSIDAGDSSPYGGRREGLQIQLCIPQPKIRQCVPKKGEIIVTLHVFAPLLCTFFVNITTHSLMTHSMPSRVYINNILTTTVPYMQHQQQRSRRTGLLSQEYCYQQKLLKAKFLSYLVRNSIVFYIDQTQCHGWHGIKFVPSKSCTLHPLPFQNLTKSRFVPRQSLSPKGGVALAVVEHSTNHNFLKSSGCGEFFQIYYFPLTSRSGLKS